ncbi:MAG: hypothetical protein H0X43_04725 [Nitrosospira sp.]|nr:hypothetical protein [Nitrosospira sp.]
MTPTVIMDQAVAEGLSFKLSDNGSIKVLGEAGIVEAWAPSLREHKAEIGELLRKDSPRQRVMEMLASNPNLKYAVVVEDSESDLVLVKIGLRGVATFDLEIPRAHYDGVAIFEVIEQYSTEATLKPSGNVYALPNSRNAA